MLVLERNYGQSIYLTLVDGQRIKVQILGTHQNRTILGIDAPKNVVIEREEILGVITQNVITNRQQRSYLRRTRQ